MSNIFGNLTTNGLEESTDTLGGRYIFPTDAYTGTIKAVFTQKSKGGAHGVTVILDLDGKEYSETIYITDKEGKNYFLNKQDPSKKVPLPGFTIIDDLCMIATETPLCEQEWEKKVHKVYSVEAGKEMPTSLDTATGLIGKAVGVCIVNEKVDVTQLVDGKYVPSGKTRNQNTIKKIFHPEHMVTMFEARKGVEPEFVAKWKEKYQNIEVDKTKGATANSGESGAPTKTPAPAPKKSLFGNK